jgi:hypothetical protein
MGIDDYSNLHCKLLHQQVPEWAEEPHEEIPGGLSGICMQIRGSSVGASR